MNKTYFYDEKDQLILEEPFIYRSLFAKGQDLIINSKNYSVDRCNVHTDGSITVYVYNSLSKEDSPKNEL